MTFCFNALYFAAAQYIGQVGLALEKRKITDLWKRRGGSQFRKGKGVNGSLVPAPPHTVNLAQEVVLAI